MSGRLAAGGSLPTELVFKAYSRLCAIDPAPAYIQMRAELAAFGRADAAPAAPSVEIRPALPTHEVPLTAWRGVWLADVLALVEPLATARFVRVGAGTYAMPLCWRRPPGSVGR